MKKRPLSQAMYAKWARNAHAFYLDALMQESSIECKQIAFHGGTSLHLSWNSPRFSEDLDFLLAREARDISGISSRVLHRVREQFIRIDPRFNVDLRNKTKDPDRMLAYHLVVSHPEVIGNVMVKVEFWRVDPVYLAQYPTEFRTPVPDGDMVGHISNPVPAATLETAYCDKLTAFATRPHLKWRDIYDLWWIGTQSPSRLELGQIARQFLHNVSAYQTVDALPPAAALRKFLENDKELIMKSADPDLKRWLPEHLWKRLWPEGVRDMVDYVFMALDKVANEVERSEVTTEVERDETVLKRMPAKRP
jgi:predicted nucleotidyltransferase component of viral defense system